VSNQDALDAWAKDVIRWAEDAIRNKAGRELFERMEDIATAIMVATRPEYRDDVFKLIKTAMQEVMR